MAWRSEWHGPGLLQDAFLLRPGTSPFHSRLCSGIVAAFLLPPPRPCAPPPGKPHKAAEPSAAKPFLGPCTETLPQKCTKEEPHPKHFEFQGTFKYKFILHFQIILKWRRRICITAVCPVNHFKQTSVPFEILWRSPGDPATGKCFLYPTLIDFVGESKPFSKNPWLCVNSMGRASSAE